MAIVWCQQKFEESVLLPFGEEYIAVSSLISEIYIDTFLYAYATIAS